MTSAVRGRGGLFVIEMITVMAILGVVLGGVVDLFTAGIKADSDQNQRFQAQQDTRLALDKLRRDIHPACTISTPTTYNTWTNSVTLYPSADACASGSHSITLVHGGERLRSSSSQRAVATSSRARS